MVTMTTITEQELDRLKTGNPDVRTNKMVVVAFLYDQGLRINRRRKNLAGSLFVRDGGVLYSYGTYWPLGLVRNGVLYINSSGSSVSTGKHRALLEELARNQVVFEVKKVSMDEMQALISKV